MRSNSLFTKAAVLSGVGLMAFGATAAEAAPYSINLISTATQLNSGLFVYQVDLAARETLNAGDFISVFDFGTFTNASASIAGFTFTNPALSPIAQAGSGAGLASPPPVGADAANVGNLMATYNGAAVTGISFTIQATSPFNQVGSDFSYGQTSDNQGPVQGKITTVTPVAVPVIPEPGTMTLLGMGALGALGMVRRRRSAK